MRVLLINRFYWPDESSTSMLATDLAEDLVEAGHEVVIFCARALYGDSTTTLSAREKRNGVVIHRLLSTRLGRQSPFRRLCDLATFHASLHLLAPWKTRPDAILVMTDPPMVLSAANWIRRLRGGKLIHHVMDVYPEVAVGLGAMKSEGLADRVLSRIYRTLLGKCDGVIALGERMAETLIRKGADPGRILIAPPWADGARLIPFDRDANPFRRELGLTDEDMLVMYSGNMGRAHCFDTILGGIAALGAEKNIHFVFIGDGARRAEIERVSHAHSTCVRLLPYVPRERLGETLSAADIHLISQDHRSVGLIVPSKLAGVLAVSRPVIFIGDPASEIAQCLKKHRCGESVGEGETRRFAEIIRELATSPEVHHEMGTRARGAFEEEYERKKVTGRIIRKLERIG